MTMLPKMRRTTDKHLVDAASGIAGLQKELIDLRVQLHATIQSRDQFEREKNEALAEVATVITQTTDTLIDAAQFMDGVKPSAVEEKWWTEWDAATREKISRALQALDARKPASLAYAAEHERLKAVVKLAGKFVNESEADLAVRYADPVSAYQDLHDALFPNPAGNDAS